MSEQCADGRESQSDSRSAPAPAAAFNAAEEAVPSAPTRLGAPTLPVDHPPGATPDDPAAAPASEGLRPAEIVRRLDEYIVGQAAAKRSVAIALRNRIRRQRLPEDIRHEVLPKNILMIGPTGVGKTEIARRLARLTSSPFLKVEATKFTEVGYVGRDVESIVRDLLELTITEVQNERIADVEERARAIAEARIIDLLVDAAERTDAGRRQPGTPPGPPPEPGARDESNRNAGRRRRALRARLTEQLAARKLEERTVDIDVDEPVQPAFEGMAGGGLEEMGMSLSDFFAQFTPSRKRSKRLSVAEARSVLVQEETDRLIDIDRVYDEAIRIVEDDGIVFIDEVDKIAGPSSDHGPDVSGEGVQRDLLPLLEGSTVHTRYGAVRTDHILFVAAGAFNGARPSDLIPEFQGRFPIRVELGALSEADLAKVLIEPSNSLVKQYTAMLATENVDLVFDADGLAELARQAARINEEDENIGARRLFTILEKVLEDLSFSAEDFAGERVVVDGEYVRLRLTDLVRNEDLRRYVL